MSQNLRWKYLSKLHLPDMKWCLKIWMALSIFFALWLLGGTNFYLMSMVFIANLNSTDASLSMKWNPVLIQQGFKFVFNYVKYRIISLSLLFFVPVVRMALKSCT